MFEKIAYEGWSGRKVGKWLREINFKTINNKPLWISNVYKILDTPFYYGQFQFPLKTGNWYQGIHEPIITKEIFMEVQKKIHLERDIKYDKKEFAFTKLMKCGRCGSGITAEEKYRTLKNGLVVKHIYYGCTRSKDLNCKNGYLREEDLILQLINIMDQININEFGLKDRLKDELDRYHKFQNILGVEKSKINKIDTDMKNYAKYILKEGNIFERRELLSYLKDKIVIKDKIVSIEV